MKTIDHDQENRSSSKKSSSQENSLPVGWTRTTMVIRDSHLEKLKAMAYWERTQMKEIIDQLLEKYISSKDIRPIPKEKRIVID